LQRKKGIDDDKIGLIRNLQEEVAQGAVGGKGRSKY
jgi:hypothetical protein